MLNSLNKPTKKNIMVHRKAMVRPEIDGLYRQKLQNIKSRIMAFCYNENNPKYKNYGGRGVTVDPKWHKIGGFLIDHDNIPGWNKDEFLKGNLQLDKDIRYGGNKLYSKETCLWVTPAENVKVKPSYQREYVGVNLQGNKETFKNKTEFIKKHPHLNRNGIKQTTEGKQRFHIDWYFYHANEKPKPPIVYKATKGNKEYKSFLQSEVERHISKDTPIGAINKIMGGVKENNIEGWTISWYPLPVE